MIEAFVNNSNLHIIIPNNWHKFQIEYILKEVFQLPRKMIHEIRMSKSIKLNGQIAKFSDLVHSGDEWVLPILNDEVPKWLPNEFDIQVLYEDDHLLIVNKPAGMSTHPNDLNDQTTLTNAVIYYLSNNDKNLWVKHIHRLDKDTTGTVLFAKHAISGVLLDRMLSERKIKRTYTALVHGKLKQKIGTINGKIGRDRHHPTRRRVSPTGLDATTHYKVLHYDGKANRSQILCQLDTGRTHQIRVHLAYLGHPLVGDTLYGGKAELPRQALHAKYLEMIHPITMESIKIEAPYLDQEKIFYL